MSMKAIETSSQGTSQVSYIRCGELGRYWDQRAHFISDIRPAFRRAVYDPVRLESSESSFCRAWIGEIDGFELSSWTRV